MLIVRLLRGSWERIIKLKRLVLGLLLINIVFFMLGYGMVETGMPFAVEFREKQLNEIPSLPYLQPLLGPLSPYLSLKIIYTFLFNLIVGALISTTLTGVIFFLPLLITVYRAWFVGIVFHGFLASPIFAILFFGTFLLEFGAYVFSAAAGINIGLSLTFPKKLYSSGRKEAFLSSFTDGLFLYVMVATLLFLGAVWEISWLHFLSYGGKGLIAG